jgi:alpha-beta hydrolase superfamily lysophospholipase
MTLLQGHEHQSLLRYPAPDGFQVNALLVTPEGAALDAVRQTPILIQVHGILGHFLARGTPRRLPHELLARGYSSLSIDTRLAHHGQMNGQGMFEKTVHDLDASVEVLFSEGFRSIFMLGYSLGAAMVVYWAAQRPDAPVRGLVLEGCHYSLPDSRRRRWASYNSVPSPDEIHAEALRVLGPDPAMSKRDRTFVIRRSKGETQQPMHSEIYTYKTYWHMLSPVASGAMAFKHIASVRFPMLFLRGEHDPLVQDGEPEALARLAQSAGNGDVRVQSIPGATHDCLENPEAMLDSVVRFMDRLRTS